MTVNQKNPAWSVSSACNTRDQDPSDRTTIARQANKSQPPNYGGGVAAVFITFLALIFATPALAAAEPHPKIGNSAPSPTRTGSRSTKRPAMCTSPTWARPSVSKFDSSGKLIESWGTKGQLTGMPTGPFAFPEVRHPGGDRGRQLEEPVGSFRRRPVCDGCRPRRDRQVQPRRQVPEPDRRLLAIHRLHRRRTAGAGRRRERHAACRPQVSAHPTAGRGVRKRSHESSHGSPGMEIMGRGFRCRPALRVRAGPRFRRLRRGR